MKKDWRTLYKNLKLDYDELREWEEEKRRRIGAMGKDLAEAHKANEALDARVNFLTKLSTNLQLNIHTLARLLTEANAELNSKHDWRTKPKPVENLKVPCEDRDRR